VVAAASMSCEDMVNRGRQANPQSKSLFVKKVAGNEEPETSNNNEGSSERCRYECFVGWHRWMRLQLHN
jgi:hypothetical protein